MTSRHTLRLALLSFALLAPASASADVIPMDVTACDMRSVGATCMNGAQVGVCTMSTCTRLDYTVDSGSGPGSTTYDCVRCVASSSSPDAASSTDAGRTMETPPRGACSASPGRAASWPLAVVGLALAWVSSRRRRA